MSDEQTMATIKPITEEKLAFARRCLENKECTTLAGLKRKIQEKFGSGLGAEPALSLWHSFHGTTPRRVNRTKKIAKIKTAAIPLPPKRENIETRIKALVDTMREAGIDKVEVHSDGCAFTYRIIRNSIQV